MAWKYEEPVSEYEWVLQNVEPVKTEEGKDVHQLLKDVGKIKYFQGDKGFVMRFENLEKIHGTSINNILHIIETIYPTIEEARNICYRISENK